MKDQFPLIPAEISSIKDAFVDRDIKKKKWINKAKEAEKKNKLGDAYYYWLQASYESRILKEIEEYNNNAEECLDIWRYYH